MQKILSQHKLQLKDLFLTGLKNVYVNEHQRDILIFPQNVACGQPEYDDFYDGKLKLTISFTLPPGCYATILIKRLMV